jgi:hypothetical protein
MSVNTLESIAGYPIAPKDENGVQQDNETLQMIESVCIAWFTIEYMLRLAGNSGFLAPVNYLLNFNHLYFN